MNGKMSIVKAPDSVAASILARRARFPELHTVRRAAEQFIQDLLALLFPHHSDRPFASEREIELELGRLREDLHHLEDLITTTLPYTTCSDAGALFDRLPELHETLIRDAEAICTGDPAAASVDEVILTYPGFLAIAMFRIAHQLHRLCMPVAPRIITEYAHRQTGIDIHPGAVIGASFCIDHGAGVVIGETTVIGDHVKLYQGVTLGALAVDKQLAQTKRHPTIEDRVIIYAGASILGGDTIIGHDSVIGGNVWITASVAPHSIVYHKSADRVRDRRVDLDQVIDFSI